MSKAKSSITPKAAIRIQSAASKNPGSQSAKSGFYQRAQSAAAKNASQIVDTKK